MTNTTQYNPDSSTPTGCEIERNRVFYTEVANAAMVLDGYDAPAENILSTMREICVEFVAQYPEGLGDMMLGEVMDAVSFVRADVQRTRDGQPRAHIIK